MNKKPKPTASGVKRHQTRTVTLVRCFTPLAAFLVQLILPLLSCFEYSELKAVYVEN